MRERPGQRCLSSEPASRWRPTRDSTGWKCLQNTLTHWQRKTPPHSCFPAIVCRVPCACIFIWHLFITFYVIFSPNFIWILSLKTFFSKSLQVRVWTPQGEWGEFLYLEALMEEQLEQDEGRVIRSKSCPPALPFRRQNAALQKEMLKSNVAGLFLPALFSLPSKEPIAPFCTTPHSVQLWCRYCSRFSAKQLPQQWSTRKPLQPALLWAWRRQTGCWYSLPMGRNTL